MGGTQLPSDQTDIKPPEGMRSKRVSLHVTKVGSVWVLARCGRTKGGAAAPGLSPFLVIFGVPDPCIEYFMENLWNLISHKK